MSDGVEASREGTAIVAGALANKPFNGGEAWVRLNWALGLQRLGLEVLFVEQISKRVCRDTAGKPCEFGSSVNRRFFEEVTAAAGLGDAACLICEESFETGGIAYEQVLERAEAATLLVNLSGHLTIDELVSVAGTTVYVDLDPGFTQIWHESTEGFSLPNHDAYLTVGLNIGDERCSIPTSGRAWRPILPPIVLERWPVTRPARGRLRFTSVATWRSPAGTLDHRGRTLELKHHQFRRFAPLPESVPVADFELALDIHPADQEDRVLLDAHGWHVVDPRRVAADPATYREYLQGSGAEFSLAQGVYVETTSGWFSDRTACYLASGRPALVQDTGLPDHIDVGEGLVLFADRAGAAAEAGRIANSYEHHCRAARAFAERYLDSDRVLGELLDELGVQWR